MTLPKDPFILVSYLNTQLRDNYTSLEELAAACLTDKEELLAKAKAVGFDYSEERNQFI